LRAKRASTVFHSSPSVCPDPKMKVTDSDLDRWNSNPGKGLPALSPFELGWLEESRSKVGFTLPPQGTLHLASSQKFAPGPERGDKDIPQGEDYMKLRLAADKIQRVAWLRDLCPWEVMATFTFDRKALGWTRGVSSWSALKIYKGWMKRWLPKVTYYVVVEKNPSSDGHHLHALWCDCSDVFRKDYWRKWKERYGRNRIELVKSPEDSAGYASKYLCEWGSLMEQNVTTKWKHLARINGWTKKEAQC